MSCKIVTYIISSPPLNAALNPTMADLRTQNSNASTSLLSKCFTTQCTVDTGEGVLIFLDLELRVQAKNMDNLK